MATAMGRNSAMTVDLLPLGGVRPPSPRTVVRLIDRGGTTATVGAPTCSVDYPVSGTGETR